MRVPLGWLGDFVDLAPGTTPDDVHAALVTVGFEEEDVHSAGVTGPVVVGQVLEFSPEPQKNGKTINWCQVRTGPDEVRGIVCGAHNFSVGDKVVVALPGAVLPGPFPIAARKTYGHVSDGMIASARELGLGEEHDGILRLASLALDPEVGTDAVSLLSLDDSAVEINVTPDRGYALSIRGVAREYGHSTGRTFRDPVDALASGIRPSTEVFPVSIEDEAPIRGRAAAPVFVTRVVRGIDAARPTPPWMIARLALAGMRSISLVVDVTNYVMLELGQPIHGYDLGALSGGLVVRRARAGETLETLDGQVRTLHPEDLLITDDSGPIGLAGVMGGAATEIGSTTSDVLIEAANFDPVSVARSARRHKLPSEASRRFERGVDPAVAAPAAERVVQLLEELAGGTADALGSAFDASVAPHPIVLPDGFIPALIGVDYSAEEIRSCLVEIGCSVDDAPGALSVTPPTWRPDLVDRGTLAEEVARITGYDRIPSVLPTAPPGRGLTREQRLRRGVSHQLASGGATEVIGSSFVSRASAELFPDPAAGIPAPVIRLANPLDAAAPFLRTSLIPGLLDVARRNLSRGLVDLAIFEVGAVFLPAPGVAYGSRSLPAGAARPSDDALASLDAGIPPQPRHVAGLLVGAAVEQQPGQAPVPSGVADALTAVRRVGAALALEVAVRQGTRPALHPGRTAEILVGDEVVGVAGELLPSLAADLDLPRVVAVWELDLDALVRLAPAEVRPHPISSFPAATQDLSLVVPVDVPAGSVRAAVIEGAGALLEDARIVDDYRDPALRQAGLKSITFGLRFRAADRTLTAQEATEAKLAGVALAAARFQAQLRE